jgi:hypothetical protein
MKLSAVECLVFVILLNRLHAVLIQIELRGFYHLVLINYENFFVISTRMTNVVTIQ